MDIGALTVFLYTFREREEILRIFEAVAGQRMMTSYFRIGGLVDGAAAGSVWIAFRRSSRRFRKRSTSIRIC